MTLKILSREDYETLNTRFKERSFMQTVEMADLLEKRGFDITFFRIGNRWSYSGGWRAL